MGLMLFGVLVQCLEHCGTTVLHYCEARLVYMHYSVVLGSRGAHRGPRGQV